MIRKVLLLASLSTLPACGSAAPDQQQGMAASPGAEAVAMQGGAAPIPSPPPQPVLDPAALESRKCADVMGFYAQAIQSGDFASAEKAWGRGLVPAGGLAGQFAAYRVPKLDAGATTEEGAAGSLYCEVPVTLTDGADPGKKPAKGTITFRRVNDVDGATPEQLRWHIAQSEIAGIGG